MPFQKLSPIIALSLILLPVSSTNASDIPTLADSTNATDRDTATKDLVPASSLLKKDTALTTTTVPPASATTPTTTTTVTTSDSARKNENSSVSATTISPVPSTSDPAAKKADENAAPNVDFGPYMAHLQKEIKTAWHPPKGDETKRVVVVFTVDRGGRMKKLKLTSSSLIVRADQAAMSAVKRAAPFDPLPAGAPETVDIQFTFDYNVWKDGIKSDNWYDHYSKRPDVASWAGIAAKTALKQLGPGLDSLNHAEAFVATLKCKVRPDGSTTDWSVHQSSGNPASDTKILDYAKENVKTVDAPPTGLPADETVALGVGISRKP